MSQKISLVQKQGDSDNEVVLYIITYSQTYIDCKAGHKLKQAEHSIYCSVSMYPVSMHRKEFPSFHYNVIDITHLS
jgi:hypothetical protein